MLLQASLGLRLDAGARTLRLEGAHLPAWLPRVHIEDLGLADARIDLACVRAGEGVDVQVTRRTGDLRVEIKG
jgi:hypothetical protein